MVKIIPEGAYIAILLASYVAMYILHIIDMICNNIQSIN